MKKTIISKYEERHEALSLNHYIISEFWMELKSQYSTEEVIGEGN